MNTQIVAEKAGIAVKAADLIAFKASAGFFVGIDSDGCVFDSMEIKHRECFCPAFINHLDLQALSVPARQVWEFVNLRSRSRGTNRFFALLRALELLAQHPEVRSRKIDIPKLPGLASWVAHAPLLSNPAIEKAFAETGDKDLGIAIRWSRDVNEAVSRIVRNVPPFPSIRPALIRLDGMADVMVVSQTPEAAIVREWSEHGINSLVGLIAGQETGTKTFCLNLATEGRYVSGHSLMIGDAPGDLEAAKAAGSLFFPIVPGKEEVSWKLLLTEALDRFFSENYAGEYEARLIAGFEAALPELPSW